MPFPLNVLGGIFHFFFTVTVNIVVIIINVLNFLHIPGALGISIILISVLIRFAVWPLMSSQIKLSKKTAQLKPQVDALKLKHGKDKQAFALAQSALFKEHGVNPAAGCLPTLIQIPIIYSLYQAVQLVVGFGGKGLNEVNQVLFNPAWQLKALPDAHFLGLNLAAKPSDFMTQGWVLLLVPVISAALTYVQSSMMVPAKIKTTEKKEDDMMSAMQTQMKYMMPLMIGYFSFTFPIGLALYWNIFTLLGIWQQYIHNGWGGLGGVMSKVGLGTAPESLELEPVKSSPKNAKSKSFKKGSTKVTIER